MRWSSCARAFPEPVLSKDNRKKISAKEDWNSSKVCIFDIEDKKETKMDKVIA